jgi:hypothetical protein
MDGKKQADCYSLSEFGHHGGLLIDEMTIQDDLVITKYCNTRDIAGILDMGPLDNIRIINTGGKKVNGYKCITICL